VAAWLPALSDFLGVLTVKEDQRPPSYKIDFLKASSQPLLGLFSRLLHRLGRQTHRGVALPLIHRNWLHSAFSLHTKHGAWTSFLCENIVPP